MNKTNKEIWTLRAYMLESYYHFNLSKNFFILNDKELCQIDTIMQICNYKITKTDKANGISELRSFYYKLQKAMPK